MQRERTVHGRPLQSESQMLAMFSLCPSQKEWLQSWRKSNSRGIALVLNATGKCHCCFCCRRKGGLSEAKFMYFGLSLFIVTPFLVYGSPPQPHFIPDDVLVWSVCVPTCRRRQPRYYHWIIGFFPPTKSILYFSFYCYFFSVF